MLASTKSIKPSSPAAPPPLGIPSSTPSAPSLPTSPSLRGSNYENPLHPTLPTHSKISSLQNVRAQHCCAPACPVVIRTAIRFSLSSFLTPSLHSRNTDPPPPENPPSSPASSTSATAPS